MKLFYDYEIMLFQKFGGISRYIHEIYIRNKEKIKISVPLYSCRNYYFRDEVKMHKQFRIISPLFNEFMNIIHLLFNKYDIIHPTYYYAERFLKYKFIRKNAKIVITVHDMIHELILNKNKKFLKQKKRMIKMADGIICISENTKKDLLEIIPEVNNKKIKVIYQGNSLENTNKDTNLELPEEYILFVGTRGDYKNFNVLLKAFPIIKKTHSNLKLLCVGGGAINEEEKKIIEELKIENSIIQINLTDAELAYAYENSKCFIFPSLYEGFGLPILEAFSCNCPVVLSNCSCFYEIAKDAAMYFDGENYNELSNIVNKIIDDKDFSDKLRNKGKEQLKNYSWDKCAKETLEFYNEILKG